jgi:N-acetyl-alpha-D-glucosaminyl L-malate synthase BshA
MALACRGCEVHFISYSRPFRLPLRDHCNIRHHQIDTIPYPLFLGPMYGISASVRIYDIIREARLDLLHVHYALPHAVCAHLANEMLDPRERVPVLTTLHGTDITLIGNTPAFQPAVKLGLDKSDALTCVSKWLSDKTCEHFDICDRLSVIYNFVDATIYKPGDRSRRAEFASENEALLLHVSNFRPVKRVLDVVRTFAGVCARLPARLLLVGDGPDRPAALELAGELGVGDRVHFLGEQADVKPYFALADLFLFPSESESFGLAAAEAMACETPVVGARAGGLPEVVEDGVSGYLLDIGDDRAMTEAAVGLLLDPARRKEMGHAGRRRVIERFAPESIVPQYELMYGRLMEMAERARAGAV